MTMHWVVVADAGRALIFSSDAMLTHFLPVADLVHPEVQLRAADWLSDDRGRTKAAAGRGLGPQSAMDPHTELKEHEEAVFAREVARALHEGLKARAFERVILVAAPSFLGQLRAALNQGVSKCVVATLSKDYTKLPKHELPAVVRAGVEDAAGLP